MNALVNTDLDDCVVTCASIDATCLFFLSTPVMCRSVAHDACRSLLKPLQAQKAQRKQRQAAIKIEGGGSRSEDTETTVATDSEEIVVRLFHSAFMVFLSCVRWSPGSLSPPAQSECDFASCCGGIVKLEREELLRLCIEAVCNSLVASGWANLKVAIPDVEMDYIREFLGLVLSKHSHSAAAVEVVRLLVLLGGALPSPSDAADEDDHPAPLDPLLFQSAFIQLVSSGTCPHATRLVRTREVSTANWYAGDVDVLLEAMRRMLVLETGSGPREELEGAIRVVLKDALPSPSEGPQAFDQWISRLQLRHDYQAVLRERGIDAGHLQEPLGRLAILERLGIEDSDDADAVFRIISA